MHNSKRYLGGCYHVQLPEGHREGYQSDLGAACLNITEQWCIRLISTWVLIAQPACTTIHKSVLTSWLAAAPEGWTSFTLFASICWSRLGSLRVTRPRRCTTRSWRVEQSYTNIPLHHVWILEFVSFCKNRIHVSEHGNISSQSIVLFCLRCFDTRCFASLALHVAFGPRSITRRRKGWFISSSTLLIISRYSVNL